MTSVEVSDNLIDHIAYCISDSILHKRIYHDATWHNGHNAHKKSAATTALLSHLTEMKSREWAISTLREGYLEPRLGIAQLLPRKPNAPLNDEFLRQARLAFDALHAYDAIGIDAKFDFDTRYTRRHLWNIGQ